MVFQGKNLELFSSPVKNLPVEKVARPAEAFPAFPQPAGLRKDLQDRKRVAREFWIAIHFPRLSLEAYADLKFEHKSSPIVITDLDHGQYRVVSCDTAAAQAGIVPGMQISAAHALKQNLQVHVRDVVRENVLLTRIARWAGCFTPFVSLDPPDALLLEVRGSLKLFGGLKSLERNIAAHLASQSMAASVAYAPTPRAAIWFARSGKLQGVTRSDALSGGLAEIPIEILQWPASVMEVLIAMGIRTIGDCLRLPRDGFSRRFGPELLVELDEATARTPQPRRRFIPRRKLKFTRDFEEECEDLQRLQEEVEPLFAQLIRSLETQQMDIQSFEIIFKHRRQPWTRRVIRFSSPVSEFERITSVLHEHLLRLVLPEPVTGAVLRIGRLLRKQQHSRRFFFADESHRGDAAARLVERIEARLGMDAIYGLKVIDDHRPELACSRTRPLAQLATISVLQSPKRRPLWLLSDPLPLKEKHGWPWYQGHLQVEQGPERIESGWWDSEPIARDYYIVRTPEGMRLWIYRERTGLQQWYLHGFFG